MVVVVCRDVARRWRLAADLGLSGSDALPPDVAASRLAHPSARQPDAVVVVVDDTGDVAWIRSHVQRTARRRVPVVAVAVDQRLANAARAAGAAAVARSSSVDAVDAAIDDVTSPAVVIDLRRTRLA